jgi:hypothetical protein
MAAVLAVLSMIPLTFLSIGFVFNLDIVNWSELSGSTSSTGRASSAPSTAIRGGSCTSRSPSR